MEYIIIALLSFSVVLLILSFFLKDPYKELKDDFDQFAMQQIQEIYQIKRKLKILDEELLVEDSHFHSHISVETRDIHKDEVHAIIKNQVWSLAQQGLSIEQIARQSSLSEEHVKMIIKEYQGESYE